MELNIGLELSKLFGSNKRIILIEEHLLENKIVTDKYISTTTNSYTNCIKELEPYFSREIIVMALKMVERHDQNSFVEKARLPNINFSTTPEGIHQKIGKSTLILRGDYDFKLLCHCKTIQLWIEIEFIDSITADNKYMLSINDIENNDFIVI